MNNIYNEYSTLKNKDKGKNSVNEQNEHNENQQQQQHYFKNP